MIIQKGVKKYFMTISFLKSNNVVKCLFLSMSIVISGALYTACSAGFEVLFDKDVPDARFRIYWSESTGSIKRASTDGSLQEEILTATGTPLDIELYMPGQKIYWTEDTGTQYIINRANLDGTGDETFIGDIYYVAAYHGPSAIAIDPGNAVMYWNTFQYASSHNDVWRSPLSSPAPVKWISNLIYDYTYCIALDTVNGNILVTANTSWDTNGTLGSGLVGAMLTGTMAAAGTGTEQFSASGDGTVTPFVPLKGIAIDGSGGYVYYVKSESNGTVISSIIKRTDLAFGSSTDWITAGGFVKDQLALDLQEGKIYWTSKADNRIYRANIDAPESGVELFIQLTAAPMGIAISP
ncbi:MAG: hypothetical protein CVV44_09635 [Spirochaetae bacterium HGW-Spirochaetae-1]|jgi:DNA-binding beta-propeller fold protein YncE|nr:MAG: hypothetical protein CVV44_09635 [Spirochaetae bacterium HGW-Spirochaetae-1]